MSRTLGRLSALQIARLSKPGLYCDGGGLYLQITSAGVKSWLFRYMRKGRAHGMGLGPIHTVTLADARVRALSARRQLLDGSDPLEARRTERETFRLHAAKSRTFDDCAADYIAAHIGSWKNAKHAKQWVNTLSTYVSPSLGALYVSSIDTGRVMKVLEPIWHTKTETALRVRNRIELILDWATVRGYRRGDNPARWRGHLDKLLPKPTKLKTVRHHPALPYTEIGAFVQALSAHKGMAALVLEFLILTASRTNEAIRAKPEQFDLSAGLWTIPAGSMKGGKEHRVPLSSRALSIVTPLIDTARREARTYLFPGIGADKPMANTSMLSLLKRMNRADITVHGFRSTFRDWAGETTHFPREVIEAALAHKLRDQAEAAYARGDLFVKRAKLMTQWAAYVSRVTKAV